MIPGFTTVGRRQPVSFGAVADRINMLKPQLLTKNVLGNLGNTETDGAACDLASDWTAQDQREFAFPGATDPFVTLGSLTRAPDGTNTARRLVEATNNGTHELHAGFASFNGASYKIKWRLAGFFKFAGRRVRLEISNGGTASVLTRTAGARATFDLVGGTVGVAAAVFGSTTVSAETYAFSEPSASIIPAGNDWYLCAIEAFSTDNTTDLISGPIIATISLDNGSGSGASSVSYVGDGSSGVYGWKTRLLPARAFDLNTRLFFDDFDDTSTIDISNTKADGFLWYPSFLWPAYQDRGWTSLQDHTQPSQYTVNSSVLTLLSDNSGQNWGFATAAYNNGDIVGQSFSPPALFECRARWDAPDDPGVAGVPAFWTFSAELILDLNFWSITGDPDGILLYTSSLPGDTFVTNAITAAGNNVLNYAYVPRWARHEGQLVFGTNIPALTRVQSATSTTVTLDKNVTGGGISNGQNVRFHRAVEHDFFEALNDTSQAGELLEGVPKSTLIGWSYFTRTHSANPPGTYGVGMHANGDDDYSNFHLYQTLWLGTTATEDGLTIAFCNGVYCNNACNQYSERFGSPDSPPAYSVNGIYTPYDAATNVMVIGGGRSDGSWPVHWDYVAVYGES